MGIPEAAVEKLRCWSEAFVPNAVPRLPKELVHKHDPRNVFISRVERVSEARPDDLVAQLAIDLAHPYHFEHPQDHVPGMMLMEAGRQLALAVAHLFYEVPMDSVFVLQDVTVGFQHFAALDEPLFIYSTVREKEYRRGRLVAMHYGGDFIQRNEVLGSMSGSWAMYDRRLMERARRRQLRGPERAESLSQPTSVD